MILVFFFVLDLLSSLPLIHSVTESNISMPICPESFSCSGLDPFKYPFYNATDNECGLIKINCTLNGGEVMFGGRSYEIVGKHDSPQNSEQNSFSLVIYNQTFDDLVKKNSCEALMNDFTLPSPNPLLYSISIFPNITLFKCTKNLTFTQDQAYFEHLHYNSYNLCKDHSFYYNYVNGTVPSDLPHTCQVVQLPVKLSGTPGLDKTQIFTLLSNSTSVLFKLSTPCDKCYKNGSQCQTNGHDVQCYAIKEKSGREQTQFLKQVFVYAGRHLNLLLVILFAVLGVGSLTTIVLIILCLKRKNYMRKKEYYVKVEMFLKNHNFVTPKRYSYSQIEKMTNSFKVKLGQGGFGTVYKGVLPNQSLVAVKVLSESKGDGEDFINEVASVGRTSHVNIVSLLGFCFDGRHRALIYEFMPNGSLERYVYNTQGSSCSTQLGWEKLNQIAIGIARGLEYLYRGCTTRILHFDIKPHNILLDVDFCPKISDFGLAKLFRDKESKISMSHMRGTPGYIAPELFSRSFGEVSHKSDVYSYGMMILEMVGGRKNIEVEVDHTSEIYFPHWIYKKVELNEEQLGLHDIESDDENRIARKMIIVGLWCIQTNPLNRPTITKVLEMLEGDLASLEIPPKPYLSSPPRSHNSPSTN